MKTISACTMDCPDACSLVVTEKTDGSVSLRGNPDHPFTAGFACKKIRNHIRRLRSPDRILHPLLRRGEQWQRISWDEALDLCAQKIQALRHEPAAILHFHSDGAKGVLKQAVNLFFACIGASRIRGTLCDGAGYIACVQDFGSRENNTPEDLLNAGRIVNWGKDLSRSSVHLAAIVRRARKRGTKVLTISPGGYGNGSFSDDRVRLRPGTDRMLAAAVIRRMLSRNEIAPDIFARTRNPDTFRAMLRRQSEARLLAACDLPEADIETVRRYYEADVPVATLVGAGLQRYCHGGENVRFINALALLAGHMGRTGGGSYFHLHSMGNFDLSWAGDLKEKPRRSFREPTIGRDLLAAGPPEVRMIWVNGSNFINQAPDCHQNIRAFERIGFRVVTDAFMTDTARRADLVLPSALMLEQADIVGSFLHRHVQYAPAVLPPPGEARDDFQIISELGRRLDPPVLLPDADACFRMSLDTPQLNTTPEELRARGSVRANLPDIAYAGMRFDHPDGRARLPTVLHPEPGPPEGYPLRFLTLVRRDAIHSQMLPDPYPRLPEAWVAPECRALTGLDLSQPIFIVSPLGRLKVSLQLLPGLHPGTVVYRRGDWMSRGGGANQLIAARRTDMGGGAAFYDQYVRLENG
ncbi:molybdopterin oxidoreductase [Desulfonema ishimotonii]|uniref:Molybdopterin oxidoreductase n=1 Tax=Desulfonema ishimotonii TaxID=45657 RepID=A0A401G0U7_9BACT|nr:molybdopterin-dependent oxidoreductase [Desulfonema ishimotonii]GBC62845.1 molybdopterin oxidoreductase [Desulfonema ishimotonii]